MKRITPKYNTGGKVVIGFFIATIFLIGTAGLTYYTLDRLVATTDELAQPNRKLNILHDLQSQIVQITHTNDVEAILDLRIQDSSLLALNLKLDELKALAIDTLEAGYIQRIGGNVASLAEGYVELYEVKLNLANRNFSEEALQKVELGIRRRSSNSEVRPLKRFNSQDFLKNGDSVLNQNPIGTNLADPGVAERNLLRFLESLQRQNSKESGAEKPQALDSVLYSIRNVIKQIHEEESVQRQKLADLESNLSKKQGEIVATIQNLVDTLQRRALAESNRKNEAASSLGYSVTLFLGLMVLIAIFGISMMIFSILKEIKLNKKYQENLFLSQQKAQDLARSKQEFLANMSHEIRNPLHVIQGYLSVLEKEELDLAQQSHLRMIGFASETLTEIVDEILDFSKLEAGKLHLEQSEFDPELLFGSIQNLFDLKAVEKQLQFNWELDLPEGKMLIGDQLRLKQILNNLLSNAFKFTSTGAVNVKIKWGENTLHVEVADTGLGMSEEVLRRVFREFDQGDASISRKYGGTGLGLAIVQRLISLIGGEINAESQEGVGTQMTMTLPMLAGGPIQSEKECEEQTLDLSGKSVLLVDDDPIGIKYLETVFQYFGATCTSYEGGLSFRNTFDTSDFDLAVIDIHMPEFSGFQVIQMLRKEEKYFALPILAMTANVFLDEEEEMIRLGFDDILIKPFKELALLSVIGKFFPENLIEKIDSLSPNETTGINYQLSDLRKFCMGDENLLQDILQDLIFHTRKDLERLKKAWLNNRFETILELTHQMASRLGQINSPTARLATKIESNLKMKNRNGLSELLITLDQEVSLLLDGLSKHGMVNLNKKSVISH